VVEAAQPAYLPQYSIHNAAHMGKVSEAAVPDATQLFVNELLLAGGGGSDGALL